MAISCGWVGRGGNARFPTFQLAHDRPTNGRTNGQSLYRVACPQLKMGKKKTTLCILDYLYFSLTNKCLVIFYLGPDLGFERTGLGLERPNLGFKRPDFGFLRSCLGSKSLDLGSERPDKES